MLLPIEIPLRIDNVNSSPPKRSGLICLPNTNLMDMRYQITKLASDDLGPFSSLPLFSALLPSPHGDPCSESSHEACLCRRVGRGLFLHRDLFEFGKSPHIHCSSQDDLPKMA
ncbi:hypothetical protein Ae201684P_012120 [Aphanomyces euteiches]|uniref:Uncharacterized protein n=1 Tax=Aphanomyces euteiches TaxID=100861 RepID=A0A6G0W9R0_9STRA|nr:hypothetical protein Ae201684_017298 [Aphanomyces euteiches]KAH9081148.1 hypothetical protein Ae201684P_012120 [Aphanomyces euteiches]